MASTGLPCSMTVFKWRLAFPVNVSLPRLYCMYLMLKWGAFAKSNNLPRQSPSPIPGLFRGFDGFWLLLSKLKSELWYANYFQVGED